LKEYFNSVDDSDQIISKSKARFFKTISSYKEEITGKPRVPYFRDNDEFSKISYDDFFKLSRQRRSVRWFKDKPVPREFLDKAILVANQAPSACNRQPFEYRIIDDPNIIEEAVNLPMGTAGYGHTIPVLVIAVGNLDAYFDERDRHLIYIDASLANMSMMYALETLGLSSCSINWPDIEDRERKMDKFLQLKPYQRAIMCIGVGYHDKQGKVAFSEKKPINKIRKYN
jgi:nitroreductase